jgi:hypothetical protein
MPKMDISERAYTVRRLTPQDAEAIPRITERVNGPAYIHQEVYHPKALIAMNESGERLSVVAIHEEAGVVGHYALERPDLGRFAETGEAMVLPEHQHHHVLDKMRTLLEEEAARIALTGVFGNAVTHHVFSQKMEERFKAVPTGFELGSAPATAHRLADFPQRVSLVTYFKYLQHPGPATVYCPEHHRPIAERIFRSLGRKVTFGAPGTLGGEGELELSHDAADARGAITIRKASADMFPQLRKIAVELQSKSEAVFAEIHANDPGAIEICLELEQMGYFFCGIEPRDEEAGDRIMMQILTTPLDLSLVQTADYMARDLLAYIGSERERVSR